MIGLFLFLLLVSPLPMGGNRDWAWAPMTIVVGALAVAGAFGLGTRRGIDVQPGEARPLALLALCFMLMLGIGALQMSTLAPKTASAAFYARAAAILGSAHAPVPTLAIDASLDVMLKCMACGLIFAFARACCVDRRTARLLLVALLVSALLVSIYAFLGTANHSCFVGNYLKKEGDYSSEYDYCLMSGTFVNSNSFACFLGMALVAAIALISRNQRSRRRYGEYLDENAQPLEWLTLPRLAMAALALIYAGGLLLSGSRAGFAATLAGLAVLAVFLLHGRLRSRRQMGRLVLASTAVGGLILVLAGSAFVQKMSRLPESGNINRVIIWETTLKAIQESPWLGWGLGSFADIYSVLQPAQIPQPNDKAHSTPLETILELGIPGGVIAIASVLLPWWIVGQAAWRRRRHRYLPAAAFAASAVAILHSTIDFSLQMPAIGFFVSALLGMGWAQAFAPSEPEPRPFTERDG
ncbi:O-antigen ligase family protein [Enhydrobacter aerosaccus]|uniref:O-antigen ligase family protein n=1 Tax=Enhydrobacter aerosaccus TaxID=225324 RepID=UPI001482523C|nr:O-antigen ligase family protein [Enhydrobacter aerosaccus]